MFEFTEELKDLLKNCNNKLKDKYENQSNLKKKELRELIQSKAAGFYKLNEFKVGELEDLIAARAVVGVDGSVNTQGKVYPHYITLLQALAKSTVREEQGILKHEIFSPLLEDDKDKIIKKLSIANNQEEGEKVYAQEAAGQIKSSLLAQLEVLVAIESINKWNPRLIMMDGSLTRYKIQAEEEWNSLVKLALSNDVLIVGVIEEIGTRDLSLMLADDFPAKMKDMYDRELMFGLLEEGEMMIFKEEKEGLRKAFLRPCFDPGVIGIDLIKEQDQQIEKIAKLVHALTPKDGRGIPIWLDIVDEEVRISNKMMELIIDNYLDPLLKQKLFHSKRSDRIY